jgi:hypothetical protein
MKMCLLASEYSSEKTKNEPQIAAVAECLPSRIQNFVDLCIFFLWILLVCTEFWQNSSAIFEFYSSIKQEVDCVSYLNSAVPYRILNLAGKNFVFVIYGGEQIKKMKCVINYHLLSTNAEFICRCKSD